MIDSMWSALAAIFGGLVAIATAIIGYFSLRYKASTGSVDDLKDRLEAAGAKAARVETEHVEHLANVEQRLTLAEEAEDRCLKRLKKVTDDLTEHRFEAVDMHAKIRELTLEVTQLTGVANRARRPVVVTGTFDGIITGASDNVAELTGWLPEELLGQHVDVLLPTEYHDRHRTAIAAAKARQSIRSEDLLIVGFILHRNKSEIPVFVALLKLSDTLIEARINRRSV